jgi:acetolactate synthase-1/2/3 large subunit
MKLSDYISQTLENYIEHLFLLPGGGCIHLVDSFSKSKIELVPVLHEQAASIAAESYAQKTNSLAALLVTTGPGATNAVTGIASAWLDSIPVLVISGQVQNKDRTKNLGVRQLGFQEINTVEIYKSITKYAVTVDCAKDIKYHLEKAIWLATHERPGPVLLDIPLDIQATDIDSDSLLGFDPPKVQYDTSIIASIKEDLIKAKRPILLVGNGVRLSDSIPLCLEFINKTNIPVLTSWKMMDLLDDNHPQFVGRPGGVGQRGANFNQQNSDFIICVGARLDHGQLAYQHKYFAREAKKCIVDIDQNEINKLTCEIEYPVCMDAKVFFTSINNLVVNKLDIDKWLLFCKKLYNKYPVVLPEYLDASLRKVNIYAFIHYLSHLLPEGSLLVPGSSGACSEVTMQAFKMKSQTRIYNSEGLGSMGFGIPAAIGGCLANNKKTTICIDGDGGFFMNIQELELVYRYNLPIKFFILNNNGYGSIRTTQNTHFSGRVVASDPQSGLTLPSIEKNAYAYNIPYALIRDQTNLEKDIENILNTDGPIICELLVDENHKTIPKASVYKKADGSFETRPMEDLAPFLDREEFLANLLISPIDINI